MPTEFRFLVFSPGEAAGALTAFARSTGRTLPAGRVLNAEPVGENQVNGRLLIDDGTGVDAIASFSGAEVLEALIAYSLKHKIPLPMASEKTLERLHGRFALRIGQVDSVEFQMRTHAPPKG